MEDNAYKMGFDPNTLGALGIQMYATFQPVILELVSNAYDAEASKVTVTINYDNKSMTVEDDGVGMTFKQLNNEFLRIGRNRRKGANSGYSKNRKRDVTGKKGLGKLASFGIAQQIIIESSSEDDQYINGFIMDIDKIMGLSSHGEYTGLENYKPDQLHPINKDIKKERGTTITVKNITLGNIPDIKHIAERISVAFRKFDSEFNLTLIGVQNGEKTEKEVTSEDYFKSFDKRIEWKIPDDPIFENIVVDGNGIQKLKDLNIDGTLFVTVNPMKKVDSGIKIFVRGKLTVDSFYFDMAANDNFSNVLGGYINFDFVDDDDNEDYVASGRQLIFWDRVPEHELIFKIFKKMLGAAQKNWRELLGTNATKHVDERLPENFFDGLNKSEADTLRQFKKSLIKNSAENADIDQLVNLLETAKDMFRISSFTEYINELDEENITPENVEKITTDWSEIEAKELAKVAIGRISAINAFETFIRTNESENKVIQPFLEKFPWLLNPRSTSFEREVTYNKLLNETFPAADLPEGNKRLDFITTNINGTIQVVELKRPGVKLGKDQIEQILRYKGFIEEKKIFSRGNVTFDYENDIEYYLVSDDIKPEKRDVITDSLIRSLDGQNVYLRSYTSLLSEARQYNRDLLKVYNNIAYIKGSELIVENDEPEGTNFRRK